jgi:hypothetical protein
MFGLLSSLTDMRFPFELGWSHRLLVDAGQSCYCRKTLTSVLAPLEERLSRNPISSGPYKIAVQGKPVGSGAAGSIYVTVHAVAKSNQNIPYCVPNELICSELGRHIRLPLPPAGIIRDAAEQDGVLFASLNFNLTGNSLPPVDLKKCWNELADLSTGLIAFDVLIGNPDRSATNFAVDFCSTPL